MVAGVEAREAGGRKTVQFSVDSALLRELGERLVGKPHIALAELIKNAYDADASIVEIAVGEDFIDVSDNGHGMTETEFKDFFMRIGSPHKQEQGESRGRARPLTGSKGVGRLSVQFLASMLELTTKSDDSDRSVHAIVDWRKAVATGELTSAEAEYELSTERELFPGEATTGTTIRMEVLRHAWAEDDYVALAREIWSLQSPFEDRTESSVNFKVVMKDEDGEPISAFEDQIGAWLNIWHAKVAAKSIGDLVPYREPLDDPDGPPRYRRDIELTFEFIGEAEHKVQYTVDDCPLDDVSFEIRFFHLQRRQKFGLAVGDARDYLERFGGVHVYDAGFRLPYYGPETDWLEIEVDHAHRRNLSKLLPSDLQVKRGMNFLPTNTRIFGVVNVNTGAERTAAEHRLSSGVGLGEGIENRAIGTDAVEDSEDESPSQADPIALGEARLEIQISRDRLIANRAFKGLRKAVRWAVDYYAMQEAARAASEAGANSSAQPMPKTLNALLDTVDSYQNVMPSAAHAAITKAAHEAVEATEAAAQTMNTRSAMLATLASAGMAGLALQHETDMHLGRLEQLASQMEDDEPVGELPKDLIQQLLETIEVLQGARSVFASLLNAEDRELRARQKAGPVVESVLSSARTFLRGTPIDTTGLDGEVLLPHATHAEWAALFQNALINAVNASLDAPDPQIAIRSVELERSRRAIWIEDKGIGVDLSVAEDYFEPFARGVDNRGFRVQLGLGGTGLGLTIMRMIATSARSVLSFQKPSDGFNTCLSLEWQEK